MYFDADWHASKQRDASFYRVTGKQDSSGLYCVSDYDMYDHLLSTGFVSSADEDFIMHRQGHFVYYNTAHRMLSEGDFVNGYREGIWKYYGTMGQKNKELTYQRGELQADVTFDEKSGKVTTEVYYKDGMFASSKDYENGVLERATTADGKKLVYYPSGKVKTESMVRDGNYELLHRYDENGNELPKEESKKGDAPRVFQFVEQMPEAPYNLNDYLSEHLQYPSKARKAGIEGRVLVQFVVAEDGTISNVHVVKAVHPLLDQEALNIVSALPPWLPGKQNGKPVKVIYTLPLKFKLS